MFSEFQCTLGSQKVYVIGDSVPQIKISGLLDLKAIWRNCAFACLVNYIYLLWCWRQSTHVSRCIYGHQRTSWGSQCLLSTVQVLGIKLRSLVFGENGLYCWAVSPIFIVVQFNKNIVLYIQKQRLSHLKGKWDTQPYNSHTASDPQPGHLQLSSIRWGIKTKLHHGWKKENILPVVVRRNPNLCQAWIHGNGIQSQPKSGMDTWQWYSESS